MRLIFTDDQGTLCDINYANAEIKIKKHPMEYGDNPKMAYYLIINDHQLQVMSQDKEPIERIVMKIQTGAVEHQEHFYYCNIDYLIKGMAKKDNLKKSNAKNNTYNKYMLKGIRTMQESPEKITSNVGVETLNEALWQANQELRRFIPKK